MRVYAIMFMPLTVLACSQSVSFEGAPEKLSISNLDSGRGGTSPLTICASLGGSADCSQIGGGLLGSMHILPAYPPEADSMIAGHIDYVVKNGVRLEQRVRMTQFNVPTREFTEGFPLPSGGLLKGPNGQAVTAWFALDLSGKIEIKTPYTSGQYQFAFFVDDGAQLEIDGQMIFNFDGYHQPQWGCSNTAVTMNAGESRSIRLRYFQGPPHQLALRLMIRPYNPNLPCSENGGYEPVPPSFLSH